MQNVRTHLAEGFCSTLQAATMPVVWFQIPGLPESKRSVLQQTPHLDMSVVAAQLQCGSLKLQLENLQTMEVSVKAASPLQALDELRDLTGCSGCQDDPFLFSAETAETGMHFRSMLSPFLQYSVLSALRASGMPFVSDCPSNLAVQVRSGLCCSHGCKIAGRNLSGLFSPTWQVVRSGHTRCTTPSPICHAGKRRQVELCCAAD